MDSLNIALIVIWLLTGLLVLFKDKVSKIDYLLIWTVLVLQLINNVLKHLRIIICHANMNQYVLITINATDV